MNNQTTDALLDPEYRKQVQGLKDVTAALKGEPSSPVIFSTDAESVLNRKVSTTYLAEIKLDMRAKAPIPAAVRNQLTRDANNIKATAIRKQTTLDRYEEVREQRVAQEHFELGCWLHYYSDKVGLSSDTGFKARVECAMRLFLSGITSPHYDFFTVFDFGERQFDTIFEMGDSDEVIDRLRYAIQADSSGLIEKAFSHHGWRI